MTDEESRMCLLRDALAVLALPPAEQIRAEAPGCAVCDILADVDNAISCVTANDSELPVTQRAALARIATQLAKMDKADVDCDTVEPSELLGRPAWETLRTLAVDALRSFGWEGARVPNPVELKPGFWHRGLAE